MELMLVMSFHSDFHLKEGKVHVLHVY